MFAIIKRNIVSVSIMCCMIIIIIGNILSHKKKPSSVIKHDAVEYYLYLPALFIYNDLIELDFENKLTKQESVDYYWVLTNNEGKKHIKYTMGVALLYSPFFLGSHLYTTLFQTHKANGFSTPYHVGIVLCGIFFLFIGLYNLKHFLLNYFSKHIVAITLFLIVVGTNLFNYSSFEIGMSHVYTFALLSSMLNYFKKWLNFLRNKHLLYVGFLFGLVVLIRPINLLFLLFFLFFEINSWSSLKFRFLLFVKHKKALIGSAVLGFVVFIPQFIYWKLATGNWVYYSYGSSEGFFFNDPKIIEGLLSYRKGWFVYTPIMLVGFIALFFSQKKHNHFKFNILLLIIPYLFLSFSWWCWWYGGSFGMRPLIDIYPIMSIAIGFAVLKISKTHLLKKVISFSLIIFMVWLNLFQTYKYQKGYLHHDSMTERVYWNYLLKNHTNGNYWESLRSPDYVKAMNGDRDL